MDRLKSVLITGATGIIGKRIVRIIAEKDDFLVTILARTESNCSFSNAHEKVEKLYEICDS